MLRYRKLHQPRKGRNLYGSIVEPSRRWRALFCRHPRRCTGGSFQCTTHLQSVESTYCQGRRCMWLVLCVDGLRLRAIHDRKIWPRTHPNLNFKFSLAELVVFACAVPCRGRVQLVGADGPWTGKRFTGGFLTTALRRRMLRCAPGWSEPGSSSARCIKGLGSHLFERQNDNPRF